MSHRSEHTTPRLAAIDVLWRRPVACYLVMAYALSWGCITYLLARRGFDLAAVAAKDTHALFLAMLAGPFASGLLLTGVFSGRSGLLDLWQRATRWDVAPSLYAFALLPVPALMLAILGLLSTTVDPAFTPRFRPVLFLVGLIAGFFEEVGWTGFATPRLLERQTSSRAGFSLGVIWALWHALADFAGNSATMGGFWFLWFGVFWLAALPAYRMLMTRVYAHTHSVFVAMLMHAGYTGWLFALWPETSVAQGLVWQSAFVASLWLMVAATHFVDRYWRA